VVCFRAVLLGIAVIATCAALVATGVVFVVRWGAGASAPAVRIARYVLLLPVAAVVSGVLAAGAGGRLVMRLLAATSPESHGEITEGAARIGDITVGGTLGFLAFVGVPARGWSRCGPRASTSTSSGPTGSRCCRSPRWPSSKGWSPGPWQGAWACGRCRSAEAS
jgi:hypothetical protein